MIACLHVCLLTFVHMCTLVLSCIHACVTAQVRACVHDYVSASVSDCIVHAFMFACLPTCALKSSGGDASTRMGNAIASSNPQNQPHSVNTRGLMTTQPEAAAGMARGHDLTCAITNYINPTYFIIIIYVQ